MQSGTGIDKAVCNFAFLPVDPAAIFLVSIQQKWQLVLSREKSR